MKRKNSEIRNQREKNLSYVLSFILVKGKTFNNKYTVALQKMNWRRFKSGSKKA